MISLIGKKVGMTRFFLENGTSIPITVIKIQKNYVTQIKTKNSDGYYAIQLTSGEKKLIKLNKSEKGHFFKAKVNPGFLVHEFRLLCVKDFYLGQKISVEVFSKTNKVDVIGFSKGKGFSGTIKRWNFHAQDATHGNSLSHRVPGSIGQNQTPGKVFKGKKMPGHLGNKRVTIQNLSIIKIDYLRELILIKGNVPGSNGNFLFVRESIKYNNKRE